MSRVLRLPHVDFGKDQDVPRALEAVEEPSHLGAFLRRIQVDPLALGRQPCLDPDVMVAASIPATEATEAEPRDDADGRQKRRQEHRNRIAILGRPEMKAVDALFETAGGHQPICTKPKQRLADAETIDPRNQLLAQDRPQELRRTHDVIDHGNRRLHGLLENWIADIPVVLLDPLEDHGDLAQLVLRLAELNHPASRLQNKWVTGEVPDVIHHPVYLETNPVIVIGNGGTDHGSRSRHRTGTRPAPPGVTHRPAAAKVENVQGIPPNNVRRSSLPLSALPGPAEGGAWRSRVASRAPAPGRENWLEE